MCAGRRWPCKNSCRLGRCHWRVRLPIPQNHLIDRLPRTDRQRLLRLADDVQLPQSQVLGEVSQPTGYVYFPVDGFISLVTSIDGKPVLEVGMVGREGLLGAQVALGVLAQPLHAVVQGPGSAWRIAVRPFQQELTRNSALQKILGRYVCVLMTQLASAAACTRYHEINPRLGRWLLMMQDRAHTDTFGVTHEFLAYMLGVRRVGITAAAGALQKEGLIEYHRGKMTVLDRRRLEAAACSCYADDCRAYQRLMR
jgi:CRP-like cAMP-binding protein